MTKEITEKKPTKLIKDGLPAYRKAYLKEFYALESPRVVHESHITLKGDRNNMMKRPNGEIRDREKVIRGLKIKDTPILTGYQIYHNYMTAHESRGQDTVRTCEN